MRSEHPEGQTLFVSDVAGPIDFTGFFEDDGETGYLYISDNRSKKVIRHLQIYNDAAKINATEEQIRVVWDLDGKKCGVIIFGGMRGIIDVSNGLEARAKMMDRASPPIQDSEWLGGFEDTFR